MMAYVASEGRLFALNPSRMGNTAGRRGALRICNAAFLIASGICGHSATAVVANRFGSLADILRWLRYVRFTPKADIGKRFSECPLRAIGGLIGFVVR